MVSAWSIGTSQRKFYQQKDTPGPGAYTPYQHHNKTPNKWKIGTEKSRQKQYGNNKVPGPGQYEPSLSKSQTLKKFPQYVFGIKNYQEHVNDNPGPGQYNQNEQPLLKSQPKYTFGLKTGSSLLAQGKGQPSPADYNIDRDVSIKSRPSSKIGRANRTNLYPTGTNPKIGYYNVASTNVGPQYSFGTSSRIQSAKTTYNDNPGPGSYKYQSQLKKNHKTIGQKLTTQNGMSLKDLNSKPGPQDYYVDVNYIKRANPGIKIGRDQRNKLTKEEQSKPAPNHYRPSTVDKKKPATYKIGTELRGKVSNIDNPGPGTYTLDSSIGQGKKYPMGHKNFIRELDQYPGPADYLQDSSAIKSRPQSCKIGSSTRTKFEASQNPGPGTYQYKGTNEGPQISFGKQVRTEQHAIDNPGPGTYKIPPKFADVPAYLINTKNDLYV